MATITSVDGKQIDIAADRLPAALAATQRQITMTHNDIRNSTTESRLAAHVAALRVKLNKLMAVEQQIVSAIGA